MQERLKNRLLRKLPPSTFSALAAHLEPVELVLRQVVGQARRSVDHVYFPDTGQVSLLAKATPREVIEVGMVGFEGMTEFVPEGSSPLESIVQVPGSAHRIRSDVLLNLRREHPVLSELIFRYQRCFEVQIAFTALSHGSYSLSERLARWLLMVHDRLEDDNIPLVQEFFSWMLAVRRAGISEAIRALQAEGCIATRRGVVTILSRDQLIEIAAGSFGQAEAEYKRLIVDWSPPVP
ncbi:MAG: helix-turn-helix domain-containing protein [Beijerinckiaceae bacterium]|nr:helix-turn-helix domain-containing protein [Beijerinckiaceae bacterium]